MCYDLFGDRMYFINYSKCSTCKKAKKFLHDRNINYIDRQIKDDNPKYDEIKRWIYKYDINVRKLFNTSGILYREMRLKEKLNIMSEDEMVKILAQDGMLVKRPLLITDDKILIGFKEKEWIEYFK